MSTLKTNTTIPKVVSSQDDLDFQFLKKIGIEYIESLGGNLWTDYNTHDPGITILDMLCYTISDLGNRIELPIEHILSKQDGSGFDSQFYTAQEILPNRATTALDYRKLFINIDGVRNCWLRKHARKVYVDCKHDILSYNPNAYPGLLPQYQREFEMKGLYDLLVDFDISDELVKDSPEYLAEIVLIKNKIRECYQANRNLCEDLINIIEIKEQPFSICAKIEVEKEAIEEQVHAKVLFEIQKYFSPQVAFYSLKQMLKKKYDTTEIFDGPLLEYSYTEGSETFSGIHFIDTNELRNSSLRTQIRLSDIMNIISSIDGVKEIIDITIGKCDGTNSDEWVLCVTDGMRPVICDKSVFNYTKDVLPLIVTQSKVDTYLDELQAQFQMNRRQTIGGGLDLPEGKYLDTDWYTTMQNDFPDTYGIGIYGLPSTATIERKSQAKQLKAYLLFFDQILASYFAQLGVVKDLLAIDGQLKRTYYTQAVKDLQGFDELVDVLVDYPTNDDLLLSENLFGDLDNINERRNQLLDHLIARFAEKFSEYTFLMNSIYGSASTELIVTAKQSFLNDYVNISSNRGGAFNYYKQLPSNLWDTDNVSGSEERIARLVGFKGKDFWRRNVSNSYVEIYSVVIGTQTFYRWKIRDVASNIILSSTVDFTNRSKASVDLNLAVLMIIQTKEADVENLYNANGFADGVPVGNLLIKKSIANEWTFDVRNLESLTPSFVIAKHLTTYVDALPVTGAKLLKDAMLAIIEFMKFVFSEEGIFIVEHMLLRPDVTNDLVNSDQFMSVELDDCVDCACIDPYSYRVSVVLPGYTNRFANMNFRDFMENLIREELPAHILPKICWVGERKGQVVDLENELVTFEKTYKEFLINRTNSEQAQHAATLIPFIDALESLHSIYPYGQLYDCESEDINGKIILGRTNLGTL